MNTLNQARQLQDRTKQSAIRIINAFARLPKDEASRIIGRQFLRSETSLAANYRAACRARSAADFISKISVVTEEADETLFWFELLVEAELISAKLATPLLSECTELLKIFSACSRNGKAHERSFKIADSLSH
jgi:four helix bundle protein